MAEFVTRWEWGVRYPNGLVEGVSDDRHAITGAIVNGSGYTPVRRKVVVQEGPWVEVALPGASTKAPR